MNSKQFTFRMIIASITALGLAARVSAEEATVEVNRQRLTTMTANEKAELLQQQERFERLSAAEKKKLRQLDSRISTDPKRDHLFQVMRGYSDWLRALPSRERMELMNLPTTERVERIRSLMEAQERQRFEELFGSKLQFSDQKVLFDWVHRLVQRDETRIMQQLTPRERQQLVRVENTTQRRLMMAMFYRWRSGEVRLFELLQPTEDDIKQLATQLSPLARDTLASVRDVKEREQLIQRWTRAVLDSRARPPLGKEELQRFLQEDIAPEQRAYLENLPRERMRIELQRMYFRHRFNGPGRPGSRSAPFPNPAGKRGT